MALREAVRQKFQRDNHLDYSTEQITVGCGAKQVVFNALFASLDPEDELSFLT
jgi:aspartate aminotransferase